MVGYIRNDIFIGYMDLYPIRKKPCLVVKKGNQITKVATFNNYEAVRCFIDHLAEATGAEKVDWMVDDVPEELRIEKGDDD